MGPSEADFQEEVMGGFVNFIEDERWKSIRTCVASSRSSLYIGQLEMYINMSLCVYFHVELPHRGKTVVVGPNAGSTWGG